MSEPGKETNSSDGRWWEFYFVRYFVGTVVGAAILIFISSSNNSTILNHIIPKISDQSTLDPASFPLLATLGLAFCYIASAPVLVLHATREVFMSNTTSCSHRLSLFGPIVFVFASAAVFFFYQTDQDVLLDLSIVMLAVILLLQIVLISFAMGNSGERTHVYYTKLTTARSKNTEEAKQYVESYKHLREHGNAFFILFFELILGMVLYSVSNSTAAFIVLLLWTLPAAAVWFLGTTLEYRFANSKH